MLLSEDIRQIALAIGFHEAGKIPTAQLRFSEEIRRICEGNVCRRYAKTWACPPAVGTVEECAARCRRFDTLLLLSGRYELEDSFDYEGMIAGMRDFKQLMARLDDAVRERLGDCLFLSNEGCGRCQTCTYPAAPCRFPQKLHHSIEGYGLNVSEMAVQAGMKYNNGPNTVTYFGGVLLNEGKTMWIFFDIGSTLVDESACYQRRYEQIARHAGVDIRAVKTMAEALFDQNKKGDALAAAHFGVPLPAWSKAEERLYPCAARVLEALRRRGYHLGVIANQSPGTSARLEAWGIRSSFDVVIASAEAGMAKPDAAIFRKALSEAGCTAEEAVMVGDRIDNDIAPARALGMKTVWIRQGPRRECMPRTEGERATWTVETLDGLLDIL